MTATLFIIGYAFAYLCGFGTFLLSDEGKALLAEHMRNRAARRWYRRFVAWQRDDAARHALAAYTQHKAVNLIPDVLPSQSGSSL